MKNVRNKAAWIGGLASLVAVSSAGCAGFGVIENRYPQDNQSYYQGQQPQEPAPGGVFVGGGSIFSAIGAYKGNPNASLLGDQLINAGGALNGRTYGNRNGSYPREYIEIDGRGNAWQVKDFGNGGSIKTPIGMHR